MTIRTMTETNPTENAIQMRRLRNTSTNSEESTTMQNNTTGDGVHAELAEADSSEAGPAEEVHEYPTGLKFWLVILTLGALLVLGGLDTNIVATAVPSITHEFHTVTDIGWYSSVFRLCSCAFQFAFGKSYKLFSVKRTFLFANVIFLVGSLICSTATTSSMFIVGRAITGAGFAGIIGGFFTVLIHILPLRKRPFYCGMLGGVESLAVLAAPILGGVLTQSLGWRWCFWINLPIGGVTLLMIMFLFSDPKPSDSSIALKAKLLQLDPLSNLLFIPGLTSLFIGLSWAGTKYPWSDGKVIGLFVTFAVLIAAFLYNQRRRGDAAVLPPRIMKNRTVIAGALFAMCTNSAINVLEYYLPTYYQVVCEYSPSKSGYMMAPVVVGSTIGMFLCGSGTSMFGYYTPFMLLSSIIMPIFAGLITTFTTNTDFARLILFTGASGFASGVGFNAPISAVQTVLSTNDAALGLAVVLFAQHFGPAVSVAIAQVVFTNQLKSNLARTIPSLNSTTIENNGLLGLTERAPSALHNVVLTGVSKSLSQTWYIAVGLTCATLLGSLLMEWRSVKEKAI